MDQPTTLKPISDETLRHYLLGGLDPEARDDVDQRLMTGDELAERVRLAESELIDDYTSGTLSADAQQKFQQAFLVTEDRRQKVELSSSLQAFANEPRRPQPQSGATTGWWGQFVEVFSLSRRPAWAIAGSFALLVLLAGSVWFALYQRNEPTELVRNEPVPSATQLGSVQPSPLAVSPSPAPPKKAETIPTPELPAPPTIAAFVLLPGATRAGGDLTRVAVPGGERDTLRLLLVLEAAAGGPYQAHVATAEGQVVVVRSGLKPQTRNGDTRVSIDVPARLIHARDYQITLTQPNPDSQHETVGRYYFRAQK